MRKFEQPERPTARDVASIVVGGEPPEWLVFAFTAWVIGLALQSSMINALFTRSEARERLDNIARAAKVLLFGLSDPPLLCLLEEPPLGAIPDRGGLLQSLNEVQCRVKVALNSPNLATEDGTAPKGRGRAAPAGTTDPKTVIAGMIAVAWREVRGTYPGPRNRTAWEAADALWLFSTGQLREAVRLEDGSRRGEDRLTGWRWRFEAALAENPVLGVNHDEFVRHLRVGQALEAHRRADQELCERLAREGELQKES
jgi:hypothetical protein